MKPLSALREEPPHVRILNGFLLLILLNLAVTSGYAVVIGTYPKNAFLASFYGQLGLAIATLAFKTQITSPALFPGLKTSTAYIQYILTGFVILLGAYTFLG